MFARSMPNQTLDFMRFSTIRAHTKLRSGPRIPFTANCVCCLSIYVKLVNAKGAVYHYGVMVSYNPFRIIIEVIDKVHSGGQERKR
jgi:hypothetical protein